MSRCLSSSLLCTFTHLAFWCQFLSFFFLFLSHSACVFLLCFSLRVFHHSLSVFLSLCLSGMVWLVLIYFRHYLVLGEDKHAFACLMNQAPLIPLSMRTHIYTGTRTYEHTRTHKHKQTHCCWWPCTPLSPFH